MAQYRWLTELAFLSLLLAHAYMLAWGDGVARERERERENSPDFSVSNIGDYSISPPAVIVDDKNSSLTCNPLLKSSVTPPT